MILTDRFLLCVSPAVPVGWLFQYEASLHSELPTHRDTHWLNHLTQIHTHLWPPFVKSTCKHTITHIPLVLDCGVEGYFHPHQCLHLSAWRVHYKLSSESKTAAPAWKQVHTDSLVFDLIKIMDHGFPLPFDCTIHLLLLTNLLWTAFCDWLKDFCRSWRRVSDVCTWDWSTDNWNRQNTNISIFDIYLIWFQYIWYLCFESDQLYICYIRVYAQNN